MGATAAAGGPPIGAIGVCLRAWLCLVGTARVWFQVVVLSCCVCRRRHLHNLALVHVATALDVHGSVVFQRPNSCIELWLWDDRGCSIEICPVGCTSLMHDGLTTHTCTHKVCLVPGAGGDKISARGVQQVGFAPPPAP